MRNGRPAGEISCIWPIGSSGLTQFLQFNEEDILHDKGKVTAAIAKAFAEKEFEKFRVLQDRTYQSDFDRLVAETSADQTE
mgnify:CR=1 FL=1